MLRNGAKVKSISIITGRDHSVISREISRNKTEHFRYDARIAQEAADRRAKKTNKCKLVKFPKLLKYVSDQLKEDWSPEQIAGRLKRHPPPKLKGLYISHEQIYEYIQNEGQNESGEYLYKFLRNKKPFRQKRYARKHQKQTILERVSIHLRDEEIETRNTFGHWESDTMFCKFRRGLSVQFERKFKLSRINRLVNLRAEMTNEAIAKSVESLPAGSFLSITYDNGKENAKHMQIRDEHNLKTYFCDAYSPWQKGGVENSNMLLRQYLTRKTNLDEITDRELYEIQEKLNNRPRKCLQYLSPNEMLKIHFGALNS
jgi:IS30 family transposase